MEEVEEVLEAEGGLASDGDDDMLALEMEIASDSAIDILAETELAIAAELDEDNALAALAAGEDARDWAEDKLADTELAREAEMD